MPVAVSWHRRRILRLTNPTCIHTVIIGSMQRRVVLDVPMPLAHALLNMDPAWRPLTMDEFGQLTAPIGAVIEGLAGIWQRGVSDVGLNTNSLALTLDPDAIVATPDELVAQIGLVVATDDQPNFTLRLGCPVAGLEELGEFGRRFHNGYEWLDVTEHIFVRDLSDTPVCGP